MLLEVVNNNKDIMELIKQYGIIDTINETIEGIQKKHLYPSPFHGLYHSEKVFLFALILAKEYKLNSELTQIIIDAAIYHDIGRKNDNEDGFHGLYAANRIDNVVKSKIYENEANMGYLKAIIDNHSRSIKKCDESTFQYYLEEFPLMDYNTFLILNAILKDADALDRTRFKFDTESALKEKYLKLPFSKQLITFAIKINQGYNNLLIQREYNKLKRLYGNDYSNNSTITCLHGIGHNFFAIPSILKYGILSKYRLKQGGLNYAGNFIGNNQDLWISVIPEEMQKEAYERFIDGNIYFKLEVSTIVSGYHSMRSESYVNCNPISSGEYQDERFVFDSIPIEQIKTLIISSDILDRKVQDGDYFCGALNKKIIVDKVRYYKEALLEQCNYQLNMEEVYILIGRYSDEIVKFENLSSEEQQQSYINFFEKLSYILRVINDYFGKEFEKAWKQKLGYKDDEVITIGDVVKNYVFEQKQCQKILSNGLQINLFSTHN